ncbi:MAG: PEP-CTERM sorting domain-containing protein, partial [Moraxellaceae bacterium]
SSLSFIFSVTKTSLLTIVDGGLAGDIFNISINGSHYLSSSVGATSSEYVGLDFDAALTNSAFSKFSILLAPGEYTITGDLHQSALQDSFALNATVGALRVTEAPESNAFALLGLSLAGLWAMRRRQSCFKHYGE